MENNESIIKALKNLHSAIIEVNRLWADNSEGINLNDLDAIKSYPFTDSFDEESFTITNWTAESVLEIMNKLRKPSSFHIEKAEAIYTGGGIYVYAGITNGQHFLAADDEPWFMLTDKPTMSDEVSDDDWDDMWFSEWVEKNASYQPNSDNEADEFLLAVYDWILDNKPKHGNWAEFDILERKAWIIGK